MRLCLSIVVLAFAAAAALAANVDPSPASGSESLGGRLLDDLSPDANQPRSPQPPRNPKNESEIEAAPTQHGFGVRANPLAQPLTRVRHGMQQAHDLLAQRDAAARSASAATPVQQEVIAELDALIAELSKKCNGQCQGGSGDQPPKPGQNAQSKPGKPGAALGAGKKAARDSTDRLDQTAAKPVEKGQVDELVKALWGHLPERSREQMLQSFSDEFLPKYELEIEQYYRRLSEEQGDSLQK